MGPLGKSRQASVPSNPNAKLAVIDVGSETENRPVTEGKGQLGGIYPSPRRNLPGRCGLEQSAGWCGAALVVLERERSLVRPPTASYPGNRLDTGHRIRPSARRT